MQRQGASRGALANDRRHPPEPLVICLMTSAVSAESVPNPKTLRMRFEFAKGLRAPGVFLVGSSLSFSVVQLTHSGVRTSSSARVGNRCSRIVHRASVSTGTPPTSRMPIAWRIANALIIRFMTRGLSGTTEENCERRCSDSISAAGEPTSSSTTAARSVRESFSAST